MTEFSIRSQIQVTDEFEPRQVNGAGLTRLMRSRCAGRAVLEARCVNERPRPL